MTMYLFFINIVKDLLLLLSIPVVVEVVSWFFFHKDLHSDAEPPVSAEPADIQAII